MKILPEGESKHIKRRKISSLVLLLVEIAFTVFIAGIVVPSLLRSDSATKEALALGSLHVINLAGFALSYTTQSVEFAALGSSMGAVAAFVIHFRAIGRRNAPSTTRTILRTALLRH